MPKRKGPTTLDELMEQINPILDHAESLPPRPDILAKMQQASAAKAKDATA